MPKQNGQSNLSHVSAGGFWPFWHQHSDGSRNGISIFPRLHQRCSPMTPCLTGVLLKASLRSHQKGLTAKLVKTTLFWILLQDRWYLPLENLVKASSITNCQIADICHWKKWWRLLASPTVKSLPISHASNTHQFRAIAPCSCSTWRDLSQNLQAFSWCNSGTHVCGLWQLKD